MNREDFERLYDSLTPEIRNEITAALEAARKGIKERAVSFKFAERVDMGNQTTQQIQDYMNAWLDLGKKTIFDPYQQALKDIEEKYGAAAVIAVKIRKYGTPPTM